MKTWTGWTGDNDPRSGCLLSVNGVTSAALFSHPTTSTGAAENLDLLIARLDPEDILVLLSYRGKPFIEVGDLRWVKVLSKLGVGWLRMNRVRPVHWELYQD